MDGDLLTVEQVSKTFKLRGNGTLKAVDDVSLTIPEGMTVGLVGESGCGKSTLARCIVGLHQIDAGSIRFGESELTTLGRRQLQAVRRELVMMFQDPYASLNPRRRIDDIVGMPLDVHRLATGPARTRRIAETLELVGLSASYAGRYPHELSGGQRQRVGLARALVTGPKMVICDEPVSALDVSVQAQILNLLMELRSELSLTLLFIAHDLGVVRHVAQRMAVMYLGSVVESGPADELFASPQHPYTKGLIAAVPIPDPRARADSQILAGDVPDTSAAIGGCRFHPRCPLATDACRAQAPALRDVGDGRQVACDLV